jgi:hypothetical protein
VTYEKTAGLLLFSVIFILAINMRVVIHVDNKIKVLDVVSINESGEIAVVGGY